MKQSFSTILACIIMFATFAQNEKLEQQLGVKQLDLQAQQSTKIISSANCNCAANILRDGAFATVTTVPGSSIITSSANWKAGTGYWARYLPASGACDPGVMYMWGNQAVGTFIYQNLTAPLTFGRTYTVKFNALFLNQTGPSNTYVQLALGAGTASHYGPASITGALAVSAHITSTNWATYTMTFTSNAAINALSLYPVNANTQNNGNLVSWIELDNVCIEEVPAICTCASPNTSTVGWWAPGYGVHYSTSNPTGSGTILSGGTLNIRIGTTINISGQYLCDRRYTLDPCIPTYTYLVTYSNGSIAGPSSYIPGFTPTVIGPHQLTITPTCAGSVCQAFTARINVTP